MALSSLSIFAAPLIGKYAIDVVVEGSLKNGFSPLKLLISAERSDPGFASYLVLSAILVVVTTAVGGVFLYLRGRWAAAASEDIVRGIRESLYRHLHHLEAGFFDFAETGDLVQRCSSDIETLRVFLSTDVVEIGRALILLLVVTPILFWLDTDLAWVSLCLVPLLIIFAFGFFTRVQHVFLETDQAEGAMSAVLQENLTGIRVVRAFSRQQFEIEKFAQHNRRFRDLNQRLIKVLALYWSLSDFFAMIQIGIVLIVGAHWMMHGQLSLGTLFAFMTYEAMIIWPIRHLGRVLTNTGKAVVSLGRINEVLGEAQETQESTPPVDRANGEIRIDKLHFAYPGGNPVLIDFDLHVRAGETLAIVGAPGSGKSTLIALLLRLYAYDAGSIALDGREICQIDRKWLRKQFGVVLQDPFLYSRSIENNLLVGRSDAGLADIEQVCVDANIHDSVTGFSEGYQTQVGERGVTLSGGQRQRLALARALLKDPPVLVLDDSLSAVDSGTELRILRALEGRKGRSTTIVIAHRLSSIRHADRIVVLAAGAIVQQGTHAELASQQGPYRALYAIQQSLDAGIEVDLAAGLMG